MLAIQATVNAKKVSKDNSVNVWSLPIIRALRLSAIT